MLWDSPLCGAQRPSSANRLIGNGLPDTESGQTGGGGGALPAGAGGGGVRRGGGLRSTDWWLQGSPWEGGPGPGKRVGGAGLEGLLYIYNYKLYNYLTAIPPT